MSNNLINRAQCKKFILDYAQRERHHKFTRVSAACYEYLEMRMRETCRMLVASQPSKGQTIKP